MINETAVYFHGGSIPFGYWYRDVDRILYLGAYPSALCSSTMKRFSEFLNSIDEWHAFSVGFCEVICPWKPRISASMAQLYIQEEFHYYMFGRAVGLLGLIGIAKLVQVIFF